MKSAARIGRPFLIDRKISKSITETTIIYPDGTRHDASASKLIPPPNDLSNGDHIKLEILINLADLNDGLYTQQLSSDSVAVVVIASVGRLRRAQEILRIKVSDIQNDLISFDLLDAPIWVAEALLSSKLNLTTYLCLTDTVPEIDLLPTLQSTWLSRSKLEIGISEKGYSVVIQPLTDDQYKLGIPRGAYSYLEINGNLTEVSADRFEITIYLDPEVFGALKQYESSLHSGNAQAKLESAFVSGLLHRVIDDCRKLELDSNDWLELVAREPSPVAVNIVKGFAKKAGQDPAKFFQLLFDDTEIALSYVGKTLNLVKQDLELLKPLIGDES
jgi:hypothetical protein